MQGGEGIRKKVLADGILGASFLLTLASAPFQGEGLWAAGLFHVSFASTVAGFADWFGVTSLFRRPLGISCRTDLIAGSRDKIASLAKDMVMEELLTEKRMKGILAGHMPSSVIERRLKEQGEGLRNLLAQGISIGLSAVDREWLWQAGKESLSLMAEKIDWAGYMSSVMKAFREYDGKQEVRRVLAEEVRYFLQSEITLKEARKLYLSFWHRYEEKGILNFRHILRKSMRSRDEEMAVLLQRKIFSLADEIADEKSPISAFLDETYRTLMERLSCDEALKAQINGRISQMIGPLLEGQGHDRFERMWKENRENLAHFFAERIIFLLEDMLHDEKKRRRLDAFLLHRMLPHVGELHEWMGQAVEKAVSRYDGRTMAEMVEKGAGEDVAMIRINGSLFGAVLGFAFFLLTVTGGL